MCWEDCIVTWVNTYVMEKSIFWWKYSSSWLKGLKSWSIEQYLEQLGNEFKATAIEKRQPWSVLTCQSMQTRLTILRITAMRIWPCWKGAWWIFCDYFHSKSQHSEESQSLRLMAKFFFLRDGDKVDINDATHLELGDVLQILSSNEHRFDHAV